MVAMIFFKFQKRKLDSSGYIALMSSIIIGFMLLALVIDQSIHSFFVRFQVLSYEYKQSSFDAAFSCTTRTLLKRAENDTYNGGEKIFIYSINVVYECDVEVFEINGGLIFFSVHASYEDIHTTLFLTVNVDSLQIVSWQEI